MTTWQRIIFFVIHFMWIALWVTAVDLEGKVSREAIDLLFGFAVLIAIGTTVGMLVVINNNKKN